LPSLGIPIAVLPCRRFPFGRFKRSDAMPKYGATAKREVGKAMHEFKEGKLKSGAKSQKKVTNPKQAVAIGLSEARKKGGKVPSRKKG
jgi:hypothetical protein